MSTHTEFGHAADALYTLHAAQSCELEYHLDEPIAEGYVLGLFNSNGDGLALHAPAARSSTTSHWSLRTSSGKPTRAPNSTRRCAD